MQMLLSIVGYIAYIDFSIGSCRYSYLLCVFIYVLVTIIQPTLRKGLKSFNSPRNVDFESTKSDENQLFYAWRDKKMIRAYGNTPARAILTPAE